MKLAGKSTKLKCSEFST